MNYIRISCYYQNVFDSPKETLSATDHICICILTFGVRRQCQHCARPYHASATLVDSDYVNCLDLDRQVCMLGVQKAGFLPRPPYTWIGLDPVFQYRRYV